MSRKIALIVNPAAGRGRALRNAEAALPALKRCGLVPEVHTTTRAGEAVTLAAEANASTVVAVGGDGTVQEVVNGVFGSGKSVGILPSGSGNDLSKSLGIPGKLSKAVEVLHDNALRRIDIGELTASDSGSGTSSRLFVNGVGVGFDAAVAVRTRSFRFLSGLPMYAGALLGTLGRYRAPVFRVRSEEQEFSGTRLLVAIGNGHSAGGGFLLTPRARPDDGWLDLCTIQELSPVGILGLVPSVLRGRHLSRPDVTWFRFRNLSLETDPGVPVHADGEIVGTAVRKLEVRLHPESLEVVAPG